MVDARVGVIWGTRVRWAVVVAVGMTHEKRKGKAKNVGIAWNGRRYDWVWMGISMGVRRGEEGRVIYLVVCVSIMYMALPDMEILAEWGTSASACPGTGRSRTVWTVCGARIGLRVGTL